MSIKVIDFFVNCFPHEILAKCLPIHHYSSDAKSRVREDFNIQQNLYFMHPPHHFLSSFFFSITRVLINCTLTLPPICSIHLSDGHSLPLQSNRVHSAFHTPLGSPGKLSLINVISSLGSNDKITAKSSPTLHHTWKKICSAFVCQPQQKLD